jgi:hypothetical protein
MSKQIEWAKRKNIVLIGSKNTKGFPAYTNNLNTNLFEPLDPVTTSDFIKGDGGEIISKRNYPAKMQAIHSSSALGVNVFNYWKKNGFINIIAYASGLCPLQDNNQIDIRFEQKFNISKSFPFSPNIDVIIENDETSQYKVFAIECKFSEVYSNFKHSGIDPKYFETEINQQWKDIPNLFSFAKSISPIDKEFKILHPAQLIKHILGLKRKYGKRNFRLMYLWYDVVGIESHLHSTEIARFTEITKSDGIQFSSLSYQELIIFLAQNFYKGHEHYINYLTDRYL